MKSLPSARLSFFNSALAFSISFRAALSSKYLISTAIPTRESAFPVSSVQHIVVSREKSYKVQYFYLTKTNISSRNSLHSTKAFTGIFALSISRTPSSNCSRLIPHVHYPKVWNLYYSFSY